MALTWISIKRVREVADACQLWSSFIVAVIMKVKICALMTGPKLKPPNSIPKQIYENLVMQIKKNV